MSYFKEKAGLSYEEYIEKLRTMFQQLNKTRAPLHTEEVVPYLLNGIRAGNYKMNMGKIVR